MVQKFVKERNNNSLQSDNEDSGEAYAVEQVETLATEIVRPLVWPVRNHVAAKENPVPAQSRHTAENPRQQGKDVYNQQNTFLAASTPQKQSRRIFTQQVARARPKKVAATPDAPQERPHGTYSPAEQLKTRTADPMPKLRQTCFREKPMANPAPRDLPPIPTLQQQMLRTLWEKQLQSIQNSSIESIHLWEADCPVTSQPPLSDTLGAGDKRSLTISEQTQPPQKRQTYNAAQQLTSQKFPIPSENPAPTVPQIREKLDPNAAPREKSRRGIFVRTRETASSNIPNIQPGTTHTIPKTAATKRARKAVTQDAQRKMLQKSSNRAARAVVAAAKKLAEAMAKAVKELINALVSLGSGMALFIMFSVVIVAGAFLASPLGILFADEQKSDGSVPLATAIAEIQGEYHIELERLQNGNFASVQIVGQAPDWREVVAVFASKTAGAEDGMDVFTLDEERVELLRQVFWDMCSITTATQTVDVPDSNPTDDVDDSHTKTALAITITAKTAEQMRLEYAFSKYQNDALDILLENLGSLNVPLGSLTISQEDAIALLENLPDDLDPARKAVVETAVQLVGRVTYFWGGKSLVIGWDDHWGTPTEVTAAGSGSTGTVRPFGLDCSGFVDWVFYNATNGAYYPGHGGGAATQHAYCTNISWSEAQPGDLVFYPDDSHVGIVGGTDADGNLLVIHCSGGANGVVITGSAGFTVAARPVSWSE